MAFKKQVTAAKAIEIEDEALDANTFDDGAPDETNPATEIPNGAASTAPDKADGLSNEPDNEVITAATDEKPVEEPVEEPVVEDVKEPNAESFDDQILAGGGMELADEEVVAPAPSGEAAPVEGVAVGENASTENEPPESSVSRELGPEVPSSPAGRLQRLVGNGNPLPPNAQRKAALDEKAERNQGYGGGGGGGGIGSLFAMAGQGVKSVLSGVGTGVKRAGGQKLADRFLQPTDPVSVAKRAFRQRYSAFDGAVNDMNAAVDARAASIDRLNNMVISSEAGRTLKQMAEASKIDLYDFMSDVKSGKNRDPFALKCMESLEQNPNFGEAAKSISAAQDAYTNAEKVAEANLNRLAADHGADINVAFEGNRLVDAVEKAEASAKKPLPLEVSLKDSNTGTEDKIDTEKQHKKFMEALDKIKESIAALLQKLMSKLGMGGPK